jgi:glycerol-3-phosphate dehydrogenase (NAD(P)+)
MWGIVKSSFAILGAGSWGTALAQVAAGAGHAVDLWDFNAELIDSISATRENGWYHKGVPLHAGIRPTHDVLTAARAPFVLLAVPSHAVRGTLERIRPSLGKDAVVINAAKGLDGNTLRTLSTAAAEVLGESRAKDHYCVLAGPTFAYEVIRGLPTAATVAAFRTETADRVQSMMHTGFFHVFTSDDVVGVEICGALKNVTRSAGSGKPWGPTRSRSPGWRGWGTSS